MNEPLPPMNPEVKALWTDALRSDQYQQTVGQLRDDPGGYCCLGVLCELFRIHTGKGAWWYDPEMELLEFRPAPHERGSDGMLPVSVQEWAGLAAQGEDPRVLIPEDSPRRVANSVPRQSLAGLNDAGYSFAEIADLIERSL